MNLGSRAIGVRLARWTMLGAQRTFLRGVGGYSPEAFAARGVTDHYPQASREAEMFDYFFQQFPPEFKNVVQRNLAGRDILDFGSGYGGRTVEYVLRCGARSVYGVEPVQRHITLSAEYAAQRGVDNCTFLLCSDTEIPLPDQSVDVVVSCDVIEHVYDPRITLREIRRVLRPQGLAMLAFPVYDGAMSHHLDYVVRLPGIHWLFSAETLVAAVNSILTADSGSKRSRTNVQPSPQLSFDGRRRVLPTLNGLTSQAFEGMLDGFSIELLHRRPLLSRRKVMGAPFRWLMRAGVKGHLREAMTANIACILRKQ